jgi:hypothetical protein
MLSYLEEDLVPYHHDNAKFYLGSLFGVKWHMTGRMNNISVHNGAGLLGGKAINPIACDVD